MRKSANYERNAGCAVVTHHYLGLAILDHDSIFLNMVTMTEIQEIGNRVSKFWFDLYSRQFGFLVPLSGLWGAKRDFGPHWCAESAASHLHGTILPCRTSMYHVRYANIPNSMPAELGKES
jgi:hypothetical protein